MARNILKSHNSIMLMTESPAFFTSNKTGVIYGGVIGSNFGFSVERERNKQIGTQDVVVNTLNRQPNVDLTIDYIFNPMLLNERSLGFDTSEKKPPAFSDIKDKSYNFLLLNHPDEGSDGIAEYSGFIPNFSGYEAVSFGNAYLNRYSVDYTINQLGRVNTSFVASNIKFEKLTGHNFNNTVESPAINLENGTSLNVGNVLLSGFDDLPSRSKPAVLNTKDLTVSLEDLQVGGQRLSGTHFVQNLNMDLNFDRVGLYGLGSDYVYDRKLQFPIEGTVSVSSLVSGFLTGQASGLLKNESKYNFGLQFLDSTLSHTGRFEIEEARLESYTYGMDVNGEMSFDAQFSFTATENRGFRVSGLSAAAASGVWQTLDITWANAEEFWSEA